MPYFILSTTGPLIQSWFLKSQKTSPYKLYGLSNLGSFVALGAYPFVIEPFLSLGLQGQLWSLAFILFSFVFYICIALLLGKKFLETINFRNSEDVFVAEAENNSLKTKTWLVWLALSALPSFMLFATTNHILYEVAAMPFLWILPLLIYLLSFAVCFEGGLLFKSPVNILALFVGLYPFGFFIAQSWNVVFMYQFLVYLLPLTLCAFICHRKLYTLRPKNSDVNLTKFYLFVALGGIIGASFVSIAAPFLFSDVWEFPIGIAVTLVVSAYIIYSSKTYSLSRILKNIGVGATVIIISLVLVYVLKNMASPNFSLVQKVRSFYGATKILKENSADEEFIVVKNNGIIHGGQFTSGPKKNIPNLYFNVGSGIGYAIRTHPKRIAHKPMNIGVVGLGAGTLAAYCENGDRVRFYEIDPAMIKMAQKHFTYLRECDGAEIIQGDARISLFREAGGSASASNEVLLYDVFAIDAFSGDAIPVHLLTKEALSIYRSRLAPEGILAFQITNGFVDLKPVLKALARDSGMYGLVVHSYGKWYPDRTVEAEWILLAEEKKFLDAPELISRSVSFQAVKDVVAWTDNYSALFPVLK